MLTEKRQAEILRLLKEQGSITLQELKETLGASESTIRRDLNALDQEGKLCKVFGGAVRTDGDEKIVSTEDSVSAREVRNRSEKEAVARYAVSLIHPDDYIYLDAGTTTGCLIPLLPPIRATFVTNAIAHARALAARGFQVILPGGEVKASTEALVGHSACQFLQRYHFSVGFFGTNGVHQKAGFTTPDQLEAEIKRTALSNCHRRYVLCDHEKFNVVTPVSFAAFPDATVITSGPLPGGYTECRNVITV
ncbi:MAG: DeoR/GlpR family DNA-binding transcription regulator [Eubacteriales bacterium]|nr:DeoR/GlpR family DNA-binding transcription regulator [Eubacteriales bacterium]